MSGGKVFTIIHFVDFEIQAFISVHSKLVENHEKLWDTLRDGDSDSRWI